MVSQFLKKSTEKIQSLKGLDWKGHVDEISHERLTVQGWVSNSRDANDLKIDLYINQKFKASLPAEIERDDLVQAGLPEGRGFQFSLESHLEEGLNEIEIRFPGTTQIVLNGQKAIHNFLHTSFPFNHSLCTFNAAEVVLRHAQKDITPDPKYFKNFLDVKIDPRWMPDRLEDRGGEVEAIPIPLNHNALMAEWGAALRAVELSRDNFTVIELGCAFGIWLINTGVLAKRLGRNVKLVGVEGDKGFVDWAHEAVAVNGFTKDETQILHGIAGASAGQAFFPINDETGFHWGLEPRFEYTEQGIQEATKSGKYHALPIVPVTDLVDQHGKVDLLHVDIQGGELDLLTNSLTKIQDRVAYILIGTHGRQIEGQLLDLFLGEGWVLEVEQPSTISARLELLTDGIQAWYNPRLLGPQGAGGSH